MRATLYYLVLCCFCRAFSEATKVYYKPFNVGEINNNDQSSLFIEYTFVPESSSFMVYSKTEDFEDGKYCLSLEPNCEDCFQIVDLIHNQDYDLVINEKNHRKISLHNKNNADGEFNITPLISNSVQIPKTVLDPLKKTTKKYEDLKKNSNQPANNVRNNIVKQHQPELENVEKDEKDPSFLVKNWRYILLGFLVYKIMTSSKEKKKEE